jgi:ribonuclease BN (tRNA processing enzyme)
VKDVSILLSANLWTHSHEEHIFGLSLFHNVRIAVSVGKDKHNYTNGQIYLANKT